MDSIPTEADWRSEPWCLDIPHAYRHFHGKDLLEALTLFRENSLLYQEDLMFMPRVCFFYYCRAYTEYLLSDESQGDSDGASCFFGLVSTRRDDLLSNHKLLEAARNVLRKLHVRQEWFEATPEIYGDFSAKAKRGLKMLQANF